LQLYKSYMNFLTQTTGTLNPHRCHYVSGIRNLIGYTGRKLCYYIGQLTKTDQYPCMICGVIHRPRLFSCDGLSHCGPLVLICALGRGLSGTETL